MLVLAHISHYLWVLYVIPILIVAGAIVRSMIVQRRMGDEGEDSV